MAAAEKQEEENPQDQVLKVLEALKEASHNLQTKHNNYNSNSSSSSSIKALLELETETAIFSNDPKLSNLSHHLSHLKSLLQDIDGQPKKTSTIQSFFRHRSNAHDISSVAGSIEAEIQAWIDREIIENLVNALKSSSSADDDSKLKLMTCFEKIVSRGFDRELQETILKLKVFSFIESTLCSPTASKAIREQSAFVVAALVQFNKHVFVGQVLMGPTLRSLVGMATESSIRVLCTLTHSIKSPLVDDLQSNGELRKIIALLDAEEIGIRVSAMDLIMEIGYFGRKEAIEEMVGDGLLKKLMEMQRSDGGGSLLEMSGNEEEEEKEKGNGVGMETMRKKSGKSSREMRFLERHPFASCVARFAIQLEVGEGLRQREKRAFKLEILKRVKEAAISGAEAATVLAEVLWGSTP